MQIFAVRMHCVILSAAEVMEKVPNDVAAVILKRTMVALLWVIPVALIGFGIYKFWKKYGDVRSTEDSCYYPQLSLEQKTNYMVGKYGIMRGECMMKYQRHEYLKMLMDGTWNQYLHDVDEECHREVGLAVKRIMEKEGVNEHLKKENPIEWVQRVNRIMTRVEERIVSNLYM